MKTVTANALAELSKNLGTEPIIIVGIEWVTGNVTLYADREYPGIKAKILEIDQLKFLTTDNRTAQSVSVTLDDTDSEIKGIIDSHNIHKVPCFIYQYYGALSDLNDKFLIFQGEISSPFSWNEKDRSIAFTIISEIVSYEVGFSPEEGQLEFVNFEFVGQPWPLCFGDVVHVPAQKVSQSVQGTLLDTICIVDPLLAFKQEILRQRYYDQAFLMAFFTKVANGADEIAPLIEDLLVGYVQVIISERQVFNMIGSVIGDINTLNGLIKLALGGAVATDARRAQLTVREGDLDDLSRGSNTIQLRKEQTERDVALARFKYDVQKDAFLRIAAAYNEMQQIYNQYVSLQQEICNEQRCVVEQVRIQNGSQFPQNQMIDIYVSGVKLRGTMVGDIFTFLDTPTAKFQNIELAPWQRDDIPCAPSDNSNGINLFYLKDNLSNLTGLNLLVKKRGEPDNVRHIIHVEKQIGNKVYFTLVEWLNNGQGQPHGDSLDEVLGLLQQTPFIVTPFGAGLPIDLFNGDWDISKWNSPEGKQLLALINMIPGGVNQQELNILATLIYLAPTDNMRGLSFTQPGPRDVFTITGEDIEYIQEASGMIHGHWINDYLFPIEELPDTLGWRAEIGATVRLENKDCAIYVANIVPSIIKAVYAYRVLPITGARVLSPVPSSYYIKNEMASLGTLTVTAITFPFDLKDITGEGWEDTIYVTLESSVGPNVCDVIQWLIETYTNQTVNAANFAAIKAKFRDGFGNELYPVGFCLFDRPNVLDEIERIAWEARCAIYRVGNEFFLKYLAEEPTENVTFTEDDICSVDNLEVAFPQTEGLITRLVAIWHPDYLPLTQGHRPFRVILRHNVNIYKMVSQETEFHIYNIKDLVYKSATFWLIRKSNTWKHIVFKTFLTNIRLDPFDTIKFDFNQKYISNNDVKGILNSIYYDPQSNLLSFDVELPIKAGQMDKYNLYWPANVDAGTQFPSEVEIEKGFAGGFGPGSGVKGTIDDC